MNPFKNDHRTAYPAGHYNDFKAEPPMQTGGQERPGTRILNQVAPSSRTFVRPKAETHVKVPSSRTE